MPDYFGTVELGYGHRRALIIELCEFRNTKNDIQRNILMAQFTEILIETQSHRISAIHLFPRIITRARGYTIYPVMFDQKTYKNNSDVSHSV